MFVSDDFDDEMDDDAFDGFFAIVYPRGDRTRLTVIDLMWVVDYKMYDYNCATPFRYGTRDEAIREARRLAREYGLGYDMYESRYDETTNEYLDEFE